MTIYILLLILMFCCAWFVPAQEQNKRTGLLFAVVMTAGLICGLGDMLGGYDRYIYGEIFDNAAIDLRNGVPLMDNTAMRLNTKEQGYGLFNVAIAYFTGNRYIFILIVTLFIYVSVFFHVLRYSQYPLVSFFVLFCLWYFFTYTYLRQCMAVAIVWYAIPFAVKRKPIPFFAIVILAATFHNSALLFGLVYFVVNRAFTRNQIIYIFIFATLLGLTPLGTFLMSTLGGAVNEEKAVLSARGAQESARLEYIIEALFFIFINLLGFSRQIPKDKEQQCQFNMLLLFTIILLLFSRSGDGGRMSWYFLIGVVCVSADSLINNMKEQYLKVVFVSIMLFLYLRVLTLWEFNMCPYKTFLTPGHTAAEWIYEQFEYDYIYDNNKLYNI